MKEAFERESGFLRNNFFTANPTVNEIDSLIKNNEFWVDPDLKPGKKSNWASFLLNRNTG